MQIFITGASGLIGGFIARRFLQEGHQIRAIYRQEKSELLEKEFPGKVEWVQADLLDVYALEQVLADVDMIIHCAAMVSFDPRRKSQMMKINVEGTANLVNLALQMKIPHFVHLSSVAALGRNKADKVVTERTRWESSEYNSLYAKSKHFSELEVWRGMEEGLDAIILNPSVVMGPGSWDRSSAKMFKYVYDQRLFYAPGMVNVVDVRDVAEICYQLVSRKLYGERYIINAWQLPYRDLFTLIARAFDKRPPQFRANKLIMYIAAAWDRFQTKITGKERKITRAYGKIATTSFTFSNEKVKEMLQYEFSPLEESIDWSCRQLLEYNKN